MNRYLKVLTHVCLWLAGIFLIFFIIDIFNPAMLYLDSELTEKVLAVFTLSVIAMCVLVLRALRRYERARQHKSEVRRKTAY